LRHNTDFSGWNAATVSLSVGAVKPGHDGRQRIIRELRLSEKTLGASALIHRRKFGAVTLPPRRQ
jgi:hypothetical protein